MLGHQALSEGALSEIAGPAGPGAYQIVGAVPLPMGVAAVMAIGRALVGAVPLPLGVAAVMAIGRALVGAVPLPLGVAAVMKYTEHHALIGAVPLPLGVAAAMTFTAGGDEGHARRRRTHWQKD